MKDKIGVAGAGPVAKSTTVALYLFLNTTLNMTNKWALGVYGFKFPVALTCAHALFSFLLLAPVMMLQPYRGQHMAILSKQWKGLVAIGMFLACNIVLNNLSLVHITLSLNQIIRSSIPVVTALLAVPVEGKVPTRSEMLALLVLCSGVMLSVWEGTVAGSMLGIAFCAVATVSNAAMMTFSGRILSEKLDVIRLTFYTAPVSCLALAPLFYATERARLSTYLLTHAKDATGIVLVTSANALAYNVVHMLTIQMTSAVTTTVLGMAKIIGLLVMSSLLLGEGRLFTPKLMVGCTLAVVGFAMYSAARLRSTGRGGPPGGGSTQYRQKVIDLKQPLVIGSKGLA